MRSTLVRDRLLTIMVARLSRTRAAVPQLIGGP